MELKDKLTLVKWLGMELVNDDPIDAGPYYHDDTESDCFFIRDDMDAFDPERIRPQMLRILEHMSSSEISAFVTSDVFMDEVIPKFEHLNDKMKELIPGHCEEDVISLITLYAGMVIALKYPDKLVSAILEAIRKINPDA